MNRNPSAFLLTLPLLLMAGSAQAKNLPSTPVYAHVARDEPVASVIRAFAANLGVPVTISEKVNGKINGRFSGPPNPFMDRLASVNGLTWYYDGARLHVYDSSETETSMLQVRSTGISMLRKSLSELGVLDRKTNWRSLNGGKIAWVTGPPRFIQLARELATAIDQQRGPAATGGMTVEVFPLRYALAADRTYMIRGKPTLVRGMASILRGTLSSARFTTEKDEEGNKKGDKSAPLQERETGPGARIEVNRSLNALIIRDFPENMDLYARLIEKLDVPVEQIEINVSIIDVSTEYLHEIGVEWQADGKEISTSRGDPDAAVPPTQNLLASPTIIRGGAGNFLGRIRLLSREGRARVLSRPSLLTLDKTEAIIDNSSTFHVRVAGKEDVELFPVSVGTLLRVTPRIVNEPQKRWIHLEVNIEDGRQDDENQVDDLPTVKKSTISTRAVVAEQSSLLVGGYYYDSRSKDMQKVPVLGDLPIFSLLFNWENHDNRRMARLFLISPRIVASEETNNQLGPADIEDILRKTPEGEIPDFSMRRSKI